MLTDAQAAAHRRRWKYSQEDVLAAFNGARTLKAAAGRLGVHVSRMRPLALSRRIHYWKAGEAYRAVPYTSIEAP